jgi:hypothetical protein
MGAAYSRSWSPPYVGKLSAHLRAPDTYDRRLPTMARRVRLACLATTGH